ncbi:hypothetical protein PPYR_00438 [Photinus pyralis]|uniref:Methyltransferase domain-containing protein n=1 Tax=Photinus pyralis TaxID=7054 RepID=A0A5N4B1S0_PHOPY|nr:glutathione S-transferase C-terminal domain-containing protein homolog [Photinus pyralis]KAB0803468.1 hypothetical protein PPYR_00438 [Photinus pyralis]
MADIYIEAGVNKDLLAVTLESLITIHVYKLCNSKEITLNVVLSEKLNCDHKCLFQINLNEVQFKKCEEQPAIARFCKWPAVVAGTSVTAGLSSVCRLIIKLSRNQKALPLLGFREACLMACNEVSIWTKFCEVDMINTIKDYLTSPENYIKNDSFYVPIDVSRFENHMSEPVKIHNVYKMARLKNNNKLLSSTVPVDQLNISHKFAEGPHITLSDVLLFPCFKIFFKTLGNSFESLPLTSAWYQSVADELKEFQIDFSYPTFKTSLLDMNIVQFPIVKKSLYISDPKRYNPQSRMFTKQYNIEKVLHENKELCDAITSRETPFGVDIPFSWDDLPLDASPESGALPESRAVRKCQQLENLAKATVKVTSLKKIETIVDFCSGSGHLGILVATLLPNCHVILVENKERSLKRAQERISKMNLSNVSVVQSNLDYFNARFDLGLALHACGVATDLVIQACIRNKADFVCCPCCYGGIHNCHHLSYPRSERFRSSLEYKDYLIISHSADQTHEEENVKTAQGYLCMNLIDTDRSLYANECGYKMHLSKLFPSSCTPKNNLLVGLYNL